MVTFREILVFDNYVAFQIMSTLNIIFLQNKKICIPLPYNLWTIGSVRDFYIFQNSDKYYF